MITGSKRNGDRRFDRRFPNSPSNGQERWELGIGIPARGNWELGFGHSPWELGIGIPASGNWELGFGNSGESLVGKTATVGEHAWEL